VFPLNFRIFHESQISVSEFDSKAAKVCKLGVANPRWPVSGAGPLPSPRAYRRVPDALPSIGPSEIVLRNPFMTRLMWLPSTGPTSLPPDSLSLGGSNTLFQPASATPWSCRTSSSLASVIPPLRLAPPMPCNWMTYILRPPTPYCSTASLMPLYRRTSCAALMPEIDIPPRPFHSVPFVYPRLWHL
jgi:hypothetical protein